MKPPQIHAVTLDRMIGGGQTIGTLENGKKALVWGGLPGEKVEFRVAKKKSTFVEGTVTSVLVPSSERIAPLDPVSYLSTSPWQMMTFEAEQHYKSALIEEAFELHDIVLPDPIKVVTDSRTSHYRNKVEFSWYSDTDPTSGADTLDLAFFRRGSKGKIVVDSCSLLPDSIMNLALAIRDLLRSKGVEARSLKTLLIRCDQQGNAVWQLYVKDDRAGIITNRDASLLPAQGGEIIYSDPRSPASRITKRLARFGDIVLSDTILGVPFRYATEGFFQVNVPVYEQALRDMREWVMPTPLARLPTKSPETASLRVSAGAPTPGETRATEVSEDLSARVELSSASIQQADISVPDTETSGVGSSTNSRLPVEDSGFPPAGPQDRIGRQVARPRSETGSVGDGAGVEKETSKEDKARANRVIDLYSGVGSIGLTIGGPDVTLVEVNEDAVREMKRNIAELGREDTAHAVLAASEKALEHITSDAIVIVDPPRAGLHQAVIDRLLETAPPRIIYLSCNPVTQARDVALLAKTYGIRAHKGYNFFPRTPHIEHLVILDRKL